jgi:DNA-binding transcriptional MerR regulator
VHCAPTIFECARRLHTGCMKLNIRQAAEHSGVSVHTLRYYERIGLLDGVGRSSSGYREYDDRALGCIRFMTMLRETGMGIQQMLEFTELERSGAASFGTRYHLLQSHRAGLMAHMARLQGHMRYLDEKVEYFWKLEQREQGKRVDVPVVSSSV